MKRVKRRLVLILLVLCLAFWAQQGFSQFSPPDNDDPNNNQTTDAPIDGGVSLLVAAAIGYGAKKAHAHRKKQKEGESIK
jgi:hypothetical protein